MLKNISHAGGVESTDEILFSTPFNYLFPELANSPQCRLPDDDDATIGRTNEALLQLGSAMGDPGTQEAEILNLNSGIPAVFTYLGQFIDHDITARTDRNTDISTIGEGHVRPIPPDQVVDRLRNGRRPHLDLDSLYGDGPGLLSNKMTPGSTAGTTTEAQCLYDDKFLLRVQENTGFVDVPRVEGERRALIADMRNDENVIISQLHAAFLKFHNAIADTIHYTSSEARYIKARQLLRWAYQYIVVNDYLPAIGNKSIVEDILRNGPRFYRPGYTGGEIFMPLEFSVAGFRFGHSMIRPFYRLNTQTTKNIMDILGVSRERETGDLLEKQGDNYRLRREFVIQWRNFVPIQWDNPPQKARRIDPKIAKGLFELGLEMPTTPILEHLAQRNLLRGYSLSIPTGQAVAAAMGIYPLSAAELTEGESDGIKNAFEMGGFGERTPLWYYILKEAALQTGGTSLGAVGTAVVAETLIGLIKQDSNSYLNNPTDPAVRPTGIDVDASRKGKEIAKMSDLLKFAGVPL